MHSKFWIFFRGGISVLLILAVLGKGASLMQIDEGALQIHPLFPIMSNRAVTVIAIILELLVLIGMFASKQRYMQIALPLSLFSTFLIYRIGLSLIDQSYTCSCFGTLHAFLGLRLETASKFSLLASMVIVITLIYFLKSNNAQPATDKKKAFLPS
ncbi:MAG: MauE/DoxX family redox-associated membrane protein [Limisphaerales bacterium]